MEYPKPRKCGSCGVLPAQRHQEGCDWARCTQDGSQYWVCDGDHKGKCEPCMYWGYYHGELECYEYGLFTEKDSIWGEGPDLNALAVKSTWSKKDQRYYIG